MKCTKQEFVSHLAEMLLTTGVTASPEAYIVYASLPVAVEKAAVGCFRDQIDAEWIRDYLLEMKIQGQVEFLTKPMYP